MIEMYKWCKILVALALVGAVGCQRDFDFETEIDNGSKTITLSIESFSDDLISSTRASGSSPTAIYRGYVIYYTTAGAYIGYESLEGKTISEDGSTITFDAGEGFNITDKIICIFNHDASDVPTDFSKITGDNIDTYFPISSEYLAKIEADMNSEEYALGMPMSVNDFTDSDRAIREVYRSVARMELFIKDGLTITHDSHTHSIGTDNLSYAIVNAVSVGSVGYSSLLVDDEQDEEDLYDGSSSLSFPYTLTEYDDDALDTTNKVYLHEFPHSTQTISGDVLDASTFDKDRFAIILKHGGTNAYDTSAEVLYYKLNLLDKATSTYYDVERNHNYRVVITAVNSRGYSTIKEAYEMPPSNIEYEIYDDQGGMVYSNGQYAIAMDEILSYDEILVYGSNETTLEFNNIRYVLPEDGQMDEAVFDTNEVYFKVINDGDGLIASTATDFVFTDDKSVLSAEGNSISITLSGEGECTIALCISLGNLDMGRDEITIKKIATNGDGDGALDAHPNHIELAGQAFVEGSWQSEDIDFGARVSNSSYDDIEDGGMVVYMGENATPTGYRTMDGYVSGQYAVNSYPVFSPKTRKGYYSYVNDENETRKVMIQVEQLAPFYLGHFGSTASEESLHHYNGLICEKIEEIPVIDINNNNAVISYVNGLTVWSEAKDTYYTGSIWGDYLGLGERYLNLVEGRAITENIAVENTTSGSLPTAARYCYMKNDVNGNGIIDNDEPIVWYLPAQNQALAMWINMNVFDEDDGLYRLNNRTDGDTRPYYWTCSEADPTEYDPDDPDEEWDSVYIPKIFTDKVLGFNMLEGQSEYGGKNDSWDQNHIRCVRGLD